MRTPFSRATCLCVLVAVLTAPWIGAHADEALQPGVSKSLPDLPASNYISNYYVDVGSGSKQLKIDLHATGGDVDLFVRYGTPFPEQDANASYPTISYDLLNRYAQYHSISGTSNESILILPSDQIPLQTGRWYIAIINASQSASATAGTLTATLSGSAPTASISIDFGHPSTNSDPTLACDDGFWTDTTAADAIGGNPGTTLGEQRKNALQYAANELATQLNLPIPITLHACGAHLGGDNKSAVLAHATALTYFVSTTDFPVPGLAKKYTWYPGTVAVRLAGTSMCGLAGGSCSGANNEEIEATFNMDFGTADVLNGEKFYLGYDASQKPAKDVDFITIAMHEMTHGLGFLGLVNTDPSLGPLGAKAGYTTDSKGSSIDYQNLTEGPFDDIYDDSVASVDRDTLDYKPFLGYEVNGSGDADRAAAMVSGPTVTSAGNYNPGFSNCMGYTGPCTGLRWMDDITANSSVNENAGHKSPNDFPSLYAPCDESSTSDCTTQPSSTLSHTTQSHDMMNAYYSNFDLRNMGLAVPMLAPVGWSNAVRSMPTFTTPIPSNWYDQTHSGHGFDFQLGYHDAVNGDVYFLTFYTYKSDGTPEWYQAVGHLVDGVFLPAPDQNGNTLHRVTYTTTSTQITGVTLDSGVSGSVVVDFNQAANSPVCRNVDRSGAAQLAVMNWSIGGDSGNWCMQPIVAAESHGSPDYNGHWNASGSDSGWGFELLDVKSGNSNPVVIIYLYYPDENNQATWATASGTLVNGSVTMPLQQVTSGYCRTCTKPSGDATADTIGSVTLGLAPITAGQTPAGTATIHAAYPNGGGFNRTSEPIKMLSVPTGQ